MHRIYLIPGFFGFANFGELKYFAHVRGRLATSFAARGAPVEIHRVNTLPTASLRKRATCVLAAIAQSSTSPDDEIHLVGHSTGGVDARLLVSPGASLPTALDVDDFAQRVRTVVSIASPHQGAPQAALFASMMGQTLLRALSLMTVHGIRLGSVPVPALAALAGALSRVGKAQGPMIAIVNQVYRQLLRDFDEERRAQLEEFFRETEREQALLPQLSPEAMDLFNAAVAPRPAVRYGCVVTQTRPPRWRSALKIGLAPTTQATYALYRGLYALASSIPAESLPIPSAEQRAALRSAYGEVPDTTANDAIVPTLSQLFGEVVHACWADHLDVIGHFHHPDHDPPHVDWLATRSGFSRDKFERLWDDVAGFLLAS